MFDLIARRRPFAPVQPPKALGIALGSGAARGLAHLGALKALVEAGVEVKYIAGSSAGAVIGALFAAGFPVGRMIEVARELHLGRLARPTLSKRGLSSSVVIEQLFVDLVGDLTFEELEIPLTVVATDLTTGREVFLDSGRVGRAVRASAGFIGVYAPVEIGGIPLVDGGVAMASPVGLARAMGAEVVVAVDVIPSVTFESFPGNIFSIVTRTLDILIKRAEAPSLEEADYVIEPLSGSVGSFDFERVDYLVELGERATKRLIEPIMKAQGADPPLSPVERELIARSHDIQLPGGLAK